MLRRIPSLLLVASVASLVACRPPPPPPKPPPATAFPPPAVQIVAGKGKDPCPMARVAAGPFLRGSPEKVGELDEHPQRTIHLDAYLIDQHAVTVAQYRRCVEAKGCTVPDTEKLCNWGGAPARDAAETAEGGERKPTVPASASGRGKDQHPINCVSWDQANAYCFWAGKRLPSEAEWEKAARGTDGRLFPWGNKPPECKLAAYALGGEKYCRGDGGTAPVSDHAIAASPYGVLQMAGNVFNWVADWHDRDYYAVSPERNPTGPVVGKHRVVRGGSWFSPAADLRSAIRNLVPGGVQFNYLGFRCVSTAQ